LPAAAAAIDRYLLLAEPTAANLQQQPDSRNRQTDRQRDAWQLHRPLFTYFGGNANNWEKTNPSTANKAAKP